MKQALLATTAWEVGALGATTASVENWLEAALLSYLEKTKWAWQMRKIVYEMMAQGRPKGYSVVLAINQKVQRKSKRNDELAVLSLCNNPVSLFSLVADERVSLAEPRGFMMTRLSLPVEVKPVTGLITVWFDFDPVMREESGGLTSREVRLGGSKEARSSESVAEGS